MATRIVVCPECGVPVPYGRLSCPECGSLLASVVGVSRRLTPITVAEAPLATPTYSAPPPPFPLPAAPTPLPPVAPASRQEAERPAPRPSSVPRSTQPRRVPAAASPPPTSQTAGASTLAEVLAAPPAPLAPAPAAPAAAAPRTPTRRRPTRVEDPAARSVPDEKAPPKEPLPLGRWDLAAALPSVAGIETTVEPVVSPAPPPAAPPPATPQLATPPPVPPAAATAPEVAPATPARPATRPPRLSPAYAASVTPAKAPPLMVSAPLVPQAPFVPPARPGVTSLTPPRLNPTVGSAPSAARPMTAPLTPPAPEPARDSVQPAWPTNAAVPAVTSRRTQDRTRATPKPMNGQPANSAAGMALPGPIRGGPPVPIWPPEPAGEPIPPSAVFAGAPDVGEGRGAPSISSTRAAESPRPPSVVAPARAARFRLPKLGDLQVDLPNNLADWLVAAGSGIALVGFLLPWSDAVVGAKGLGGYTDSWGLAVPSHFLVLLILGAVLTLAVIPTRVPSWIRTGVLGVLVGGLLVGLAWPYLLGGFGASLGILFETVAAALLVAAGVAERRAARHEAPSGSV